MIRWIRGETFTLLNHLRKCEHQSQNVRDEVEGEYWTRGRTGPVTPAIPVVQDTTPNLLPLEMRICPVKREVRWRLMTRQVIFSL